MKLQTKKNEWYLPILLIAFFLSHKAEAQIISTYASGIGDNHPAITHGRLHSPQYIAIDPVGNLYITENGGTGGISRVRKVNTSGIITTVAGNGQTGCNGFGGLAINAQVGRPEGVLIDGGGNLVIAYSHFVGMVNAAGTLSNIVGTGASGYAGDGSIAITAQLQDPMGLAKDAAGNIYIADQANGRIRKLDPSGIITTVAGNGSSASTGDGGSAISAGIGRPSGVAIDTAGNIYIADNNNRRIRKVNTAGIISTIAGNGSTGSFTSGAAATATNIGNPQDVKLDAAGNLYISSGSVMKVNTAGIITLFAGGTGGFSGDGGPATTAGVSGPKGMAIDAAGNLYFADNGNNRVRKVNTAGIISTVAGNNLTDGGFFGDGGDALLSGFSNGGASLFSPSSIPFYSIAGVNADRFGNVYVADHFNNRIRKINSAGIISTVAGSGTAGFAGDGGPATAAFLQKPTGVTNDKFGNIFFADFGNHHIRKIDLMGTITTIAGGGSSGLGDGGPATAAVISAYGLCLDTARNVYIVDADSQRIRKVDAITGIITTIAGNGVMGFSGDGGAATAAALNRPVGVTTDRTGNIYIAEFGNRRIRKIDGAGVITTYAGSGGFGDYSETGLGDGGPATLAIFNLPHGITSDTAGNIYIADRGTFIANAGNNYASAYSRVRRVDQYGYITTVAGNGIQGYAGDGGPAKQAELFNPFGVSIDTFGQLFIADMGNRAVRKVCCLTNPTNHPPSFTGGTLQNMSICAGSSATPINSFMTITDADVADIARWTVSRAPTHGTVSGFPDSVATTGGTIVPTGFSYTPTAGFSGLDTFTIKISDGEYYTPTMVVVSVNPIPFAGTIGGPNTVCVGASITLTSSSSGGIWSSSNSTANIGSASGIVTGVSGGIDTFTYSVVNLCGTATANYIVTVTALPVSGPISGPANVCVSATITLSSGSAGGIWTSTDPYVAVGSFSGDIAGIAPGVATISYTVTNACGVSAVGTTVTVNTLPYAGTISGTTTLCTGAITTLTSSVPGGVWSSGTTAVATIGSTGVVNGLAMGSTIISYSVTVGGCAPAVAITIVNVMSATPITPITGPTGVCNGSTITLTHSVSGGAWSSSNPSVATIGSTGVVTGIVAGLTTISYSASLGCGISVATATIAVSPSPVAGTISNSPTLCTGATSLATSSLVGGVWSMSNGSATINSAGMITGVTPGLDTIQYTVFNACGAATTSQTIDIYPTPIAGTITGSSYIICNGSTTTLSSSVSGGIWSSSSAAIASVNASGFVSGISPGTATISYVVTTGCGSAASMIVLTVNTTSAGTISGVTTICSGSTSILNSTAAGGTWTSSATSVAIINSAGLVNAVAAGVSLISYTVVGSCGTAVTTTVFTVGTPPSVSPITGTNNLCLGTSTSLSSATAGGAWSSSNPFVASISSSGIVNAIAIGTTTISYTIAGSCGNTTATFGISVSPPPVANPITGPFAVCTGATITLVTTSTGGSWSASNTNAAVSASGVVTGLAIGVDTILYAVSTGCGTAIASKIITVNSTGYATISGATSVCSGMSVSLVPSVGGGVWSSSSIAVAHVSSSGLVTGYSPGTAVISYAISGSCGTATATYLMTVAPATFAGVISGATTICSGATTTLSSSVSGGTWSSGSTTIATVNSSGLVTAISSGTAIVSYTVSGSCGNGYATKIVSVNATNAGIITGITTLCIGSSTTSGSTAGGGVWSSSTPTVATISSSGVVSALAAGITVISYSVSDACGSAVATATFTVGTAAAAPPILGPATICTGASTTFSCSATGGVWASSNPYAATVNSSGVVTAVAPGITTISYSVPTGCGISTSVLGISIYPPPVAHPITGYDQVCTGASITLTTASTGGTWSASNTNALVLAGTVTGTSLGTVTISFTVTTGCGSATATKTITVNTISAGVIYGTSAICAGSTTTLSATVAGGAWSSSSSLIATVSSTGVVTGIASGTATLSYSATNSCGVAIATFPITVMALPTVGAISGITNVCNGSTTTLYNSTSGGTWTSSSPLFATIDGSGIVTGIVAGSTTISYIVTTGCGSAITSTTVHVQTMPPSASISGPSSICRGVPFTLTTSSVGGIWNSSNITLAVISTTGVVSTIDTGVVVFSYSITNSCGTSVGPHTVVIEDSPYPGLITGPIDICVGSSSFMTNSVTTGSWTSSNTSIATINSGGLVTGLSPGIVVISYSVSDACGTNHSIRSLNINPLPFVSSITGAPSVTVGGTTVLSNAVAGGTWSSSDAGVASINASGVVSGISSGTVVIIYSIVNSFGCVRDTSIMVTVNSLTGVGNVVANNGYSIYPNPATTDLFVAWHNQHIEAANITITDVAGRVVINKPIEISTNNGNISVSLEGLKDGIYIVSIVSTTGKHIWKVIVRQ